MTTQIINTFFSVQTQTALVRGLCRDQAALQGGATYDVNGKRYHVQILTAPLDDDKTKLIFRAYTAQEHEIRYFDQKGSNPAENRTPIIVDNSIHRIEGDFFDIFLSKQLFSDTEFEEEEVPKLDEDGQPVCGEDGNPIVDKNFVPKFLGNHCNEPIEGADPLDFDGELTAAESAFYKDYPELIPHNIEIDGFDKSVIPDRSIKPDKPPVGGPREPVPPPSDPQKWSKNEKAGALMVFALAIIAVGYVVKRYNSKVPTDKNVPELKPTTFKV